jgi:N-acetylneuraminate synthase
MKKSINIGGINVGPNHPPFVIAEMSGNHNHSLQRALSLVKAAAESGVQALKLQTYTADTITLDVQGGSFEIRDPNSLWNGKNLHKLYQEAHTPWDWHKEIFDYAKSLNMVAFSSPFDETAVDFLEELGAPAYKIASFENNHVPLLAKVARTGKPVIVSTGVSKIADIELAVDTLRENGSSDYILLKCTSNYPASPADSNLRTIPHLAEMFGCQVGLSDHTLGIGAAVASVALGATVIEKHFTLRRADGGVDSAFSLEPEELKSLVVECTTAWQALGKVSYSLGERENKSRLHKRSIYASRDIAAGESLTAANIKVVRPGDGLEPRYYNTILGKKALSPISKGTPLALNLVA